LTLPAIPAAIATVATLWPTNLGVAVQWGIVVVAGATILALVADLGWGDVKLVASLGIIAGGSTTITHAATIICLAGGAHVLVHMVVDGNRRAHIPFGPALLTGFTPSIVALT
jgi:prepilin signal peptidase PulO-like enzyme (type II secretory pathway)